MNPWVGKIPLKKGMATHSSILAQRTPWTEDLAGYSPQAHKKLETTEGLTLKGLWWSGASYLIIFILHPHE